jgi:hypothetical protein
MVCTRWDTLQAPKTGRVNNKLLLKTLEHAGKVTFVRLILGTYKNTSLILGIPVPPLHRLDTRKHVQAQYISNLQPMGL